MRAAPSMVRSIAAAARAGRINVTTPAASLRRSRPFSTGSTDLLDGSVGLQPEEAELYHTAMTFAQEKMAPFAAKWDEEKHFPVDVLREAASLGLATMYVKEDVGGSAMTRSMGIPVIEALAQACPSTTAYITIHNMVAWMIDTWGSEAQRQEYLPRMASMDILSSYCLTEPNAGSDAASLQTRAVRQADGSWVLNGSKAFISGGGVSDLYLLMARTGAEPTGANGISAFLIPKDAPGLSFGKNEKKMGWNSQPTAAVFLENVHLPATALLGQEGHGFRYAMKGLDGGRLSIAACSVGGASAALVAARDHVSVRKQFGKPLSANQSVQFRLADMATDLTLSRMITRTAGRMLDAGHPASRAYCAMAKRTATEKCFNVANSALQLHGGYGYLKDYPAEKLVRDLRVHCILEGANEVMQLILGRTLLEGGK